MKMLIMISIFAAALQIAPVAFSQDENAPQRGPKHQQGGRFANLSPDEREKMKTAHQKAMQDPAVQAAKEKARQAKKEYDDALRAALLKADPSIQPILDKMPKGPMGERHED
jgi:hypothetical protein